MKKVSLFCCLFGVCHSLRDVTIASEGLQILTYARHFWPLSSEVSLACHIYCDTGHPFLKVTSYAERLAVDLSLPDLRLSRLRFELPTSPLRSERSNPLHLRCGKKVGVFNALCKSLQEPRLKAL